MRLSIIINNYNYGRFLRSAIDSALAVDWSNKEVIVVDDGSTDNSAEVMRTYGEQIRTLFKVNGGQVSAINEGFPLATGDVVVFLDADDELLPTLGLELAAVWHPGVSKVQFSLAYVDEDGRPTGERWPHLTVKHTPAWVRQTMRRCSWYEQSMGGSSGWTRSFLAQVLPLPAQPKGEPGRIRGRAFDHYLNKLAPFFGDVVSIVAEPQGLYRQHGANWSRPRQFAGYQFIANWCEDQLVLTNEVNDILRRSGGRFVYAINMDRNESFVKDRLIVRRMLPEREQEPVLRLLLKYCVAVVREELGLGSKMVRIIWAMIVAAAPRPIADWAIRTRQAPSIRPRVLRRLGTRPGF